jgi:dihydrofolate synthase/folylpolyglutamate synthase
MLERRPDLLLDGAHNEAGAQVLSEALCDLFPNQRKVLVLGMLAEKQVREVLTLLLPQADMLICTAPAMGRTAPLSPAALADLARSVASEIDCAQVQIIEKSGAWTAIELAKGFAGQDGLICLCGSLYMVGEVRQAWLLNQR